jgi:hypothetical protein
VGPLLDLLKSFRVRRAPPPGWIERHAPNGSLDAVWATAPAHDLLHLWVWWAAGGNDRRERAALVSFARDLVALELSDGAAGRHALALLDRWLAGDDDETALRAAARVIEREAEAEPEPDPDDVEVFGNPTGYARDLLLAAMKTPYQPSSVVSAFGAATHLRPSRAIVVPGLEDAEKVRRFHADADSRQRVLTDLVRRRLACPPLDALLERTKRM